MNSLVFGIEKVKGFTGKRNSPQRYSIIRVSDKRIESEEKNITLYRILKIINAERPAILAAGNIRDIVQNGDIYRILDELPFGTKFVQICGNATRIEPLATIAERYNLRFDKTNPMEEAKTAALIASFGGGYEIRGYDDITTVTVSRAKPPIRTYYRDIRKMHSNVRSRAREIEAKFSVKGLSYDTSSRVIFRRGAITVFTVKAPRQEVPVSSGRSSGIHVRVFGKRKTKPEFVSLSKKPAYIIVGIDPGTTVGIAALNLDGDLVHLSSSRALSPADIITTISGIGKPLLIATDKSEMPFGVEKIRRAFSAVPWTPERDVLIKDKYELVEGYDFGNDHERDSLSAAVSAYRSYANKFDSVQKRMPPGTDIDIVRAGIIRGISLEQILAGLQNPEEILPEPEIVLEDAVFDEKDEQIARLEETVTKLRKLAGSLSGEVEVKDKAISSLQNQLVLEREEREQEILISDEISSRDKELEQVKKALRKEERRNKNMRIRLERMKHFISLQAGEGCTALKILQLLAKDHVKSLDDEMGIGEEDILYVLKVDGWGRSVVRDLAEAKIGAVILPRLTYQRAREQNLIEEFREADIPVLDGASLSPRVKGKIGVVDSAAFENALIEWKATQAVYNNEKKLGQIHGMVNEYHVERVKDIREKGIDPELVFEVVKPKPEPIPAPIPVPTPVPVQKPSVKPRPIPKKEPEKKTAPIQKKEKTVPKPIPKKEKPVPEKKPEKKPENKPENKPTANLLFGVLSEYRAERKKELKK